MSSERKREPMMRAGGAGVMRRDEGVEGGQEPFWCGACQWWAADGALEEEDEICPRNRGGVPLSAEEKEAHALVPGIDCSRSGVVYLTSKLCYWR